MPKQKSKHQKILLLIDANSLIHRCYHALPPLTAMDGRPIQAIYGLTNILLKLFREEKPDYAAACFDRPEPTYRDEEYKDYKAQRPPTPDDLIGQLKEAHILFPLFGIRAFEAPGYEADDLIATLAEKFRNEKNVKIVILTGDLDTLQLVEDDHIVIRTFRKGLSDTFIYNEAAVQERFGLPPSRMVDYKALVGDASDNIKGVPGIGPKTAVELIKKFGSVEDMYNNLDRDEILKKKLGPFEKEARLSKKLVVLQRNGPIDMGHIDSLAVREDKEKLADYFRAVGFHKVLERFEGGNSGEHTRPIITQAQGSLFASRPAAIPVRKKKIAQTDYVFVTEESLATLAETALGSTKPKVGFGFKALIKKLRAKGKNLAPPYFDLEVAFWLLDSDQKTYAPEYVFEKFLRSHWNGTEEDTQHAHQFAEAALKKYKLEKAFYDIEMPLLPILAEMEGEGIGMSRAALQTLGKKIEARLENFTTRIYKEAGDEFNINSPKQLGEILFVKLGLGGRKKTQGGKRSTDAEALATLKTSHSIIPLILEYREDFKIKSTYVEPLQDLLDGKDRLHTEFVQTGTATGRLSSRTPNLQNIPQESIWAPELRKAFVARPGYEFLSFDYSQLELRIMASFSGDTLMQDAFKKDLDIHALTASKVLKRPIEQITKEDRRLAKTLNFGLIYGMGKSAFARTSGVSSVQAASFIENYFKEFSRVRKWQEETKKEARTCGFLITPTGRRRIFPGFKSGIPYLRAEMERAAINFPIQSLASDMIKLAMIKSEEIIQEQRLKAQVKLLLSIHDELLFEVQNDKIDEMVRLICNVMEGIYPLNVPLKVNVSRGRTWGDLEPL